MRPLLLTLHGFRSYEATTEISFEGRSFLAIVGPTGAGKSSILDGIAFALYGKTPAVKSGTKRLICSRSEAAHIRLRFAIEKDEYEVTRVLRRTGGAEHLLLDCSTGDKLAGDGVVSNRIEELVGLDFDAFCASVLLAQGRFARFLEAARTERVNILKGVFRLDEIDTLRVAAKTKADVLELQLSEVRGERAGIPDDAHQLLADAKLEVNAFGTRGRELEAAVPLEKEFLDNAGSADSKLESVRDDLVAAEELRSRLPSQADIDDLLVRNSDANTAEAGASEILDAAVAAERDAALGHDELERELGSPVRLAELLAVARARARTIDLLSELGGKRSHAADGAASLRSVAESAQAAHADAARAADRARRHLQTIERLHSAHLLKAHLVAGEPCPVCEQNVTRMVHSEGPVELEDAVASEEKARDRVGAAVKTATAAREAALAAVASLEHLDERIVEERARADELSEALTGILEEGGDPVAAIEGRLTSLDGTARRLKAARAGLQEARAAHEAHAARRAEVDKECAQLAGILIHAAGQMQFVHPGVDADSQTLAEHSVSIRSELQQKITALRRRARELERDLDEIGKRVTELRERFGLDPDVSLQDARVEAHARAERAAERVDSLSKQIARAKQLGKRERQLKDEQALFLQLKDDLTEKNFINFLLEDRRRLLSELASVQLHDLTGRYRFDDAGEFNIVDELDADKVRDVGTLSGGEMFLASLALALGLAEAVAQEGGRLQCFFLDEGFGALDPESLDLALDGIERIVHPDRLIGLVSHVAGLAARVEDKIELEKGADGMTLVKDGASL